MNIFTISCNNQTSSLLQFPNKWFLKNFLDQNWRQPCERLSFNSSRLWSLFQKRKLPSYVKVFRVFVQMLEVLLAFGKFGWTQTEAGKAICSSSGLATCYTCSVHKLMSIPNINHPLQGTTNFSSSVHVSYQFMLGITRCSFSHSESQESFNLN